jgi:hypothetical protein
MLTQSDRKFDTYARTKKQTLLKKNHRFIEKNCTFSVYFVLQLMIVESWDNFQMSETKHRKLDYVKLSLKTFDD